MTEKEPSKIVDFKRSERSAHSQYGQFEPNDELLQSTSRIKAQRDVILDRIEKMRSAQPKVSKSVFEKVFRDYQLQLETISELLDEKKALLKEEIKKLYLNREKLSFEANRHREILEEAEFRHYLQEFTQTQYQEVENFETKEIEKLESDLATISQWIKTHEELFDPTDFGKSKELPQPAQEAAIDDSVKNKFEEPLQQSAPQEPEPAPEQAIKEPSAPLELENKEDPVVPIELQDDDNDEITMPLPESLNVEKGDEITQPISNTDLPQPSTEASEDSSAPSISDFEHLFDDDSPDEVIDSSFGKTEDNIQKLLTEEEDHEDTANLEENTSTEEVNLPEPSENEQDYFQKEKVDESSFQFEMPGDISDEEEVTSSMAQDEEPEQTQESKPEQVAATEEPKIEEPKPVTKDDSISEILESIKLDGEDSQQIADLDISAGIPEAQSSFRLSVIQGELDSTEFYLKDNTSIGRSPSNDVVLKEPKVSRQHAAINKYNDSYILIDLKSSNGIYVNGAKVDEVVLSSGDEISIGGYKFLFEKT